MGHGSVTPRASSYSYLFLFRWKKISRSEMSLSWQVIASVHMTSSRCLELSNGTGARHAVARCGTLCPVQARQFRWLHVWRSWKNGLSRTIPSGPSCFWVETQVVGDVLMLSLIHVEPFFCFVMLFPICVPEAWRKCAPAFCGWWKNPRISRRPWAFASFRWSFIWVCLKMVSTPKPNG